MTDQLIQFGFIVVLPLVIVGGAVASLFAIGALFEALEDPQALRARIEGAFRPSAAPARTPGPGHYYRPHWLGGSKPVEPAKP
jgi:hypothetical protein